MAIHEKEFDDHVYEDDYYEENYQEEELDDEEEELLEDDDDIDGGIKKVPVSYACDDCDYRWEDIFVKRKDDIDYDDDPDIICPMCGSMNCSQI